jgi:ribosome-associated protein
LPRDHSVASAASSTVPSKSQLKREAQTLRAFGAQLVGLKESQLAQLPLEERLYRAILEARHLKPQAARRQLNYIGKLLRSIETAPLQQAVAQLLGGRPKR